MDAIRQEGSVCEACGADTEGEDIVFVGKPVLMWLCEDCRKAALCNEFEEMFL